MTSTCTPEASQVRAREDSHEHCAYDKSDLGAAIGGVLILLVVLALVALWIWALVDAIRVPDDAHYRAGTKLIWVLVIALTGFVGAAVYLAVGRPARRAVPQ